MDDKFGHAMTEAVARKVRAAVFHPTRPMPAGAIECMQFLGAVRGLFPVDSDALRALDDELERRMELEVERRCSGLVERLIEQCKERT